MSILLDSLMDAINHNYSIEIQGHYQKDFPFHDFERTCNQAATGYNYMGSYSSDKKHSFCIKKNLNSQNMIYYFPYFSTGERQTGYCIVPKGNQNAIFTDGMNGCSIDIYELENSFLFLHNANSKQLGNDDEKEAFWGSVLHSLSTEQISTEIINRNYPPNWEKKKPYIRILPSDYMFNTKTYFTSAEDFDSYAQLFIAEHSKEYEEKNTDSDIYHNFITNETGKRDVFKYLWLPIIEPTAPGTFDIYFFCFVAYRTNVSRYIFLREWSNLVKVNGNQQKSLHLFP